MAAGGGGWSSQYKPPAALSGRGVCLASHLLLARVTRRSAYFSAESSSKLSEIKAHANVQKYHSTPGERCPIWTLLDSFSTGTS